LPPPQSQSSQSTPVNLADNLPSNSPGYASEAIPLAPLSCDYHVDNQHPNTSDRNSGRSESDPFATIQHVADLALPGQTVCVHQGIYPEQVIPANSGSESVGDINYIAYENQEVILEGATIDLNGWGGIFHLDGKTHLRISGFQIQNSTWFGIYVANSAYITISNNSTDNTWASGIYVRDSAHILIDQNDIQRASRGGYQADYPASRDCSDLQVQECLSLDSVTNFEVKNNAVHNGLGYYCGGEGISIKQSSSYGTIHHNQVYDLPANYDPKIHQHGEVGIYIDAYGEHLYSLEVYNNISSAPFAMAVSAEQGGIVENIRIYNNILYHAYGDGLEISGCCNGAEGIKKDIYIFNNTIHACGYGSQTAGGITIRTQNPFNSNIRVDNNILNQNFAWQIRDKSGIAQGSNNIIYGTNDGYFYGDDYILLFPEFISTDPLALDFRLTPHSPAIDAAINPIGIDPDFDGNIQVLDFDYGGNLRPQGSAYDIGAYEWSSNVSTSNR
jgi:parallel beta-helix repeat protein